MAADLHTTHRPGIDGDQVIDDQVAPARERDLGVVGRGSHAGR